MIPQHDLDQLRSSCDNVRRAFIGRQNYRLNLTSQREQFAENVRQLRDRFNSETNDKRKQEQQIELAHAVDQLSNIDRELSQIDQSIAEIENDYIVQQCPIFYGSLTR